jgi:hypothetical protein
MFADVVFADLRDRVEFLQRELERKDAILLNMTEAMKAISPPAQEEPIHEPRESPVTPTGEPGGGEVSDIPPQRSWWRRLFGP